MIDNGIAGNDCLFYREILGCVTPYARGQGWPGRSIKLIVTPF